MFLLHPAEKRDVFKQEALHVSGSQAVEFITGAMNDHDLQGVEFVANIELDAVQKILAVIPTILA